MQVRAIWFVDAVSRLLTLFSRTCSNTQTWPKYDLSGCHISIKLRPWWATSFTNCYNATHFAAKLILVPLGTAPASPHNMSQGESKIFHHLQVKITGGPNTFKPVLVFQNKFQWHVDQIRCYSSFMHYSGIFAGGPGWGAHFCTI
jgi:hypothetical protein